MIFNTYKQVIQNSEGRLFAIGDVHGCLDSLLALIAKIQFDETKDQMIFVGDLADRGPQSLETCLYVLDKPWFHLVVGNHEDLLVKAVTKSKDIHPEMLAYWVEYDGLWTIDLKTEILQNLANKLMRQGNCVVEAHTLDGTRFGVTHAAYENKQWFDPETEYDEVFFHKLMWSRNTANRCADSIESISGIDYTVHGHSIFKQAVYKGNAIFIDTGCVSDGCLTALDLGEFAKSQDIVNSTISVSL